MCFLVHNRLYFLKVMELYCGSIIAQASSNNVKVAINNALI